jgi:hypothetical protein
MKRLIDAGSTLAVFVLSAVLILQGSVASAAEPSGANVQNPTKKESRFEDDFEREDLGDQYEIINPDPNRFALSDGKLIIVATESFKNLIVLNKNLNSDFSVTVELDVLLYKFNSAALYYFLDDRNYLMLGVAGTESCEALPWKGGTSEHCGWGDRRQPFFTKILDGQVNNIVEAIPILGSRKLSGFPQNPEGWHFQLRREGVRYTGQISVDGVRWSKIGTHVLVQKNGRIALGATSGGGVETAVEFDNLVLQQ